MKNLILALALCLSSVSTFAREGNEGPNGAPQLPMPELARIEIASGFVPPDSPTSTIISVIGNGSVIETKIYGYQNNRTETRLVLTLSQDTVNKLWTAVDHTSQGELVDTNPEVPMCMDAPTTTYFAKGLELAQTAGCKNFEKAQMNDADRSVLSFLKGLLQISYL